MDARKKYGLLAGLAFSIWQYFEYSTGIYKTDFAALSQFLPAPIYIVCIFMAIRAKRQELGGFMEFADGLKAGLGTSGIAAIVYSIANYIYNKWVNPSWVLERAGEFKKALLKHGTSLTDTQAQVTEFITSYPFRSSLLALASLIFMGGLISVVIAVTMRKKQPPEHTV
jgi:hypothetical protein